MKIKNRYLLIMQSWVFANIVYMQRSINSKSPVKERDKNPAFQDHSVSKHELCCIFVFFFVYSWPCISLEFKSAVYSQKF